MAEERSSIGAIWKNKTRNGDVYLKGFIEIPGTDGEEKIAFVAFKTKEKKNETSPDFRIFVDRPRSRDND